MVQAMQWFQAFSQIIVVQAMQRTWLLG